MAKLELLLFGAGAPDLLDTQQLSSLSIDTIECFQRKPSNIHKTKLSQNFTNEHNLLPSFTSQKLYSYKTTFQIIFKVKNFQHKFHFKEC